MLDLSLDRINASSPYVVYSSGEDAFSFVTDSGTVYEVGFVEDYMLGIDGVYQFFIMPVQGQPQSKDGKIARSVFAIMEEFFSDGNLILDYVCDTHDGRQAARNRLFTYWYESNPLKVGFTQQTIIAAYEGVSYYAAVILRNDNPRYAKCMEAIQLFSEDMADKLH